MTIRAKEHVINSENAQWAERLIVTTLAPSCIMWEMHLHDIPFCFGNWELQPLLPDLQGSRFVFETNMSNELGGGGGTGQQKREREGAREGRRVGRTFGGFSRPCES